MLDPEEYTFIQWFLGMLCRCSGNRLHLSLDSLQLLTDRLLRRRCCHVLAQAEYNAFRVKQAPKTSAHTGKGLYEHSLV